MSRKPRTPDDILAGLQAKALAFLRFDEPTYNPEFVEKMIAAAQEPGIPVPDLPKDELVKWFMDRFNEHEAKKDQ